MARIRVESEVDPRVVLREAGAFLASRPVVHNLILSLLHARVAHPEPGRYWVARDGPDVVGVVFQSPLDFWAALTPMPAGAVQAAVATIADQDVMLPGVMGEAGTAARFAGEWTERRCVGATPHDGQRIYELTQLCSTPRASGCLREAGEEDVEVVLKWFLAFEEETGERAVPLPDVRRRLSARRLWFWDDGGPVSFAGNAIPVEGVVRIGPVFTPLDRRRRGYAGSCVAALSEHFLAQGFRCTLFTDLANPVSNAIYRRIGYRAVAEVLRYRFD